MVRRLLPLLLLLALAVPAVASADVEWLCRPGLAADPCTGDQTTTVFAPDGSSRVVPVAVPADPPIDCFYVYPTTSNQPGRNATKARDPEIRSIAVYQAQRFSTRCRVFAPLYRQVTAAGVTLASNTRDASAYDVAYADVREAFAAYLRDDNRGRGFVLIGHSQGSRILRALIRADVDPRPEVRARLVSAIIPGANHIVKRGAKAGGDFAAIPLCERLAQTGCSLSWHTFNETPPANARFGRTDTDPVGSALGLPRGEDFEVACTDPAALTGTAPETLVPSEPFAPGVIATLLLRLYGGPTPTADTPWLQPRDRYTARCEQSGGARVLMVTPVGEVRPLTPSPDDTWGLHLIDLNGGLGNLTTIVGAQTRAYTGAPAAPLRVTVRSGRRTGRVRRVVALVTGVPGARVTVSLRRADRVVLKRRVVLGAAGRSRVTFRVRRPGAYTVLARDGVSRVSAARRFR